MPDFLSDPVPGAETYPEDPSIRDHPGPVKNSTALFPPFETVHSVGDLLKELFCEKGGNIPSAEKIAAFMASGTLRQTDNH